MEDKEKILGIRLDNNLSDYKEHILGFGKEEMFEMAGQIAATVDAHYYMVYHHEFEPAEIDSLLRFAKPLEVVADAMWERREDISDMSFVLGDVFSKADLTNRYALATEQQKPQKPSIRNRLKSTAKQDAKPDRTRAKHPKKKDGFDR